VITAVIFMLVLSASLLGAIGAILLKKGVHGTSGSEFFFHPLFLSGAFLFVLSNAFFIPALKNAPLSVVYPFVSLSYVWVALMAALFLNERITKSKIIGIFFIILGVALIGI